MGSFEQQIGMIRSELHDITTGKINSIIISEKTELTIKKFFEATLLRNPKIVDRVNAKSLIATIAGKISPSELIATYFLEIKGDFFKDRQCCYIINNSKKEFIISDSLIQEIVADGKYSILLMPISGKEAICLYEKEYYEKLYGTGKYFLTINDDEKIDHINKLIYTQAKNKKENVIGKKAELEKLVEKEK